MRTDLLTVFSCLLLLAGMIFIAVAVLGTFRFRFVLNRMHCAAIIDTLGLAFIMAGLMLLCRDSAYVPKLAFIIVFQWIGSPIASHMVGRLETETDPELTEHMFTEDGSSKEGEKTE